MEFLKETFGDSENGVRWGGVLAAVLGIGGGFYLGGGIGAAIGLASSLLAAPIMNEIFFNVNRATGNVKPPARNNDIKPNVPLEAAPAPVRQPDNKLSPTTIKAPLLKNLVPPPPGAVAKQFEKREEIRKIIVDREGGRADFEKASKEARDLEAQTDTFIATVDKYSEMRDEYHKDKGERSQLVGAVKTALGRTGITNALTQDEIERFVPSLPTLSAEQKAQVAKQMADSFPEKIKMLGDSPDLPLRQSIERSFTKGDDGKPNPAKVEAWKKKSGLEKLNYSLDRLNEMRADLESRSKLDFKLAAGGEAEAAAWRAMP
ncbi:MAG: hypothetical protein EBV03_04250, partial [Proteobacteria bacterium]|nr:hypothetical protein [Pseudomonadota bacterium]